MDGVSEALAKADGTSQAWNEVYQHPLPAPPGTLKRRFLLAQRLERRALGTGAVWWGCPSECGLARSKLNLYTRTVGLDVDIGVGSLILALNALPGVVTLSSCSSVHEGAHEEEALVAFTADAGVAARIERCVGPEHFREVRTDSVRLKGRSCGSFQSYIVRSDAAGPDGEPDARERLRQLMALARRVRDLAEEPAAAPPAAEAAEAKRPRKRRRKAAAGAAEALPLVMETFEAQRQALRSLGDSSGAHHASLSPCFDHAQLAAARDELVVNLRGLHPVEAEDVCALVHPLDASSEALQASPRLAALLATLHGEELRRRLSESVGCGPLAASPNSSLIVAVPPNGFFLPRGAPAGQPSSAALAFCLFLTEDWWSEADGGLLELYEAEAARPSATVLPCFNTLLVYSASAGLGATRVATERAPQLAIHGVFCGAGIPAAVPRLRGDAARGLGTAGVKAQSSGTGPEGEGCTHPDRTFDEADREVLQTWVSAVHLPAKRLAAVRRRFAKRSRALLRGFLKPEAAEALAQLLSARDSKDGLPAGEKAAREDHDLGCGTGWQLVGPARSRRYLRSVGAHGPSGCPASAALQKVATQLQSPAFLRFLEAVTGLRRASSAEPSPAEARRFRPGLDYVRRARAGGPRLDAVLCLCGGRGWRHAGAADAYVEATEDTDTSLMAGNRLPPPLVRLRPAPNALRLVLWDARTAHFVEPLAREAGGSRWDVAVSLELEPLGEESEEEGPDPDSPVEPGSDEGQ